MKEKKGFTNQLKEEVRIEQRGKCGCGCGRKEHLDIHHIVPLSLGGSDVRSNAVGLIVPCHKHFDLMAIKYDLVPIFDIQVGMKERNWYKIADYILKNPEAIIALPAKEETIIQSKLDI